jgi:diguanylate cyclase (GGDEF)-like protein
MQVLLVHCADAHLIAQVAHSCRHDVYTVGDCAEAMAHMGRQRFDLLIAPLTGEVAAVMGTARRYGVSLWLVAEAQELTRQEGEIAHADDFLQQPVVEVVLRQRLRLYQELHEYHRRQTQLENTLREKASLDPLTQLPNRHFALQNLQLHWQRYRRKSIPFCCILCDLDDFKKNNDLHGQRFGDSLLRSVAHLLKEKLRGSDLVCRYDGQEFFILCPDTEMSGARLLAERLRAKLVDLDVRKETRVSACFAVVQSDTRFRSADQLLRLAEEMLDNLKRTGPNQVALMEQGPPEQEGS